MNRRLSKIVAACAATLALAACASPSLPAKMTASAGIVSAATPGQARYRALSVEHVQGGEQTNPLLASQVSNADFQTALESSLRAIEYLADDGAAYRITVNIQDLQQPMAGLDMSVTARVRYTVVPVAGGAPLIDEVISSTGTGTVSEALIGVERIRIANEYAVKANIEAFIRLLEARLK